MGEAVRIPTDPCTVAGDGRMLYRLHISMRLRSIKLLLAIACFAGCSTISNSDKPLEVFEPHITETTCPLHHVALREAIEPLSSGGPPQYIHEYYDAKEREFLWANTDIPSNNYVYWRARYCPACRKQRRSGRMTYGDPASRRRHRANGPPEPMRRPGFLGSQNSLLKEFSKKGTDHSQSVPRDGAADHRPSPPIRPRRRPDPPDRRGGG